MAAENKQHEEYIPQIKVAPANTLDAEGDGVYLNTSAQTAYFNRIIPTKQIYCYLCKKECCTSSYLWITCQRNFNFCYFCLTQFLEENDSTCPICGDHRVQFAVDLAVTSCEYEGCSWIGPSTHLIYHKDNECEYCIEYLRTKCRTLQDMLNDMRRQHAQYKQVWYHPGRLSTVNKMHPGPKFYHNVRKMKRKHIWMEKHCGKQMDAGFYNGIPLIQWNCCDNKWDNNTANGCYKVCSQCGIKYDADSLLKYEENGCVEVKETVQCVKWNCCGLIEEMSSFKSKQGCQSVYECCQRMQNDKGCHFVWSLLQC